MQRIFEADLTQRKRDFSLEANNRQAVSASWRWDGAQDGRIWRARGRWGVMNETHFRPENGTHFYILVYPNEMG
jgi:hypothetical protein